MKIAFISFEYPPDTAFGGIATYVWHAAHMLVGRGHAVEVFAGSVSRQGTTFEDTIVVHRFPARDAGEFATRVTAVAEARHREVQFDVIESPELNAEAAGFLARVPEVPLVVKLHTPSYLIGRFTLPPFNLWRKIRFALGALRTGVRPQWPDSKSNESRQLLERNFTRLADEVAAPSEAIAYLIARDWSLPPERVARFPLPYAPARAILDIPVNGGEDLVLFVGRLEPRKGVQHLAAAIPRIRAAFPGAKFRFVGRVLHSPQSGMTMEEFIRARAGSDCSALEFTGAVLPAALAEHYSAAAIAVFPSVWESFGYVCLEAMAAGRAVVASKAGGMREILADGHDGVLVSPARAGELARAIVALLRNPAERIRLGHLARERVLSHYSYATIAPQQEASYDRAIVRRRSLGPRRPNELSGLVTMASPRRSATVSIRTA